MADELHPLETVTSVILIRHGHTVQTETGKVYSDPSSTLTDKGIAEAREIAAWLPMESPEVLLSSPSVRALGTAEAIASIANTPVQVIESLRELQTGSWDGRSYLEIKRNEPDVYAAWSKDPIRNAPPGGESIEELCHRAVEHVHQLCQDFGGKRVALVTHAEVIRAIVVYALGMPIDNFWRISVPTASVTKIDFSANFATVHYTGLRPDVHLAKVAK